MSAGRTELSEFAIDGAQAVTERITQQRREVGNDIVSAAYLRGDFTLASGERSDFYFDKYLFETKPTILRRLAEMLAERVSGGVDRLGGTEVGGIPLVVALSLATGVPFVIIRAADPTTEANLVRGELHAGERVLLVQDVVDSGQQAKESATRVKQLGAHVAGILSVIDRENGGASNISAAGYEYDSLFDLSELAI